MYKINVKSEGKYHNVTLGPRYTLSKRDAKNIIAYFLNGECELEVTKLLRCGVCWMWSDDHDLYNGYWEK